MKFVSPICTGDPGSPCLSRASRNRGVRRVVPTSRTSAAGFGEHNGPGGSVQTYMWALEARQGKTELARDHQTTTQRCKFPSLKNVFSKLVGLELGSLNMPSRRHCTGCVRARCP